MAENRKRDGRVYHRTAKPRKSASRTFGESADWSDHEGCEALYRNRPLDLLRCLRPWQWVKNLLLLVAPFFAFFDGATRDVSGRLFRERVAADPVALQENLGLAVVAFILLSGAAYVINDLADAAADARNPLRRNRPIAARQVSGAAAGALAALCAVGGLALAWSVSVRVGCCGFFWVAVAYAVIQPLYTFVARRWAEVAAMLVAGGFVLRAAAGALVVSVRMSPWLLLCVFLLALFVALCKRRSAHFVKALPQPTVADGRVLDLEIGALAAVTIACYALYTLSLETRQIFGTQQLVWTLPLVMLGVFRFLRLTYEDRSAGNPESLILRDPVMWVSLVGWGLACGGILWFA